MFNCPPRVMTTGTSRPRARSATARASARNGQPVSTISGRPAAATRSATARTRGWLARIVSSHGCTSRPRTAGMGQQALRLGLGVGLPGIDADEADGAPAARRAGVGEALAGAREVVVDGPRGRRDAGGRRRSPRPSASSASSVAPLPSKCGPA